MQQKVDVEQFICSMIEAFPGFQESGKIPCMYKQALADQGLEYYDGYLRPISSPVCCDTIATEHVPMTIDQAAAKYAQDKWRPVQTYRAFLAGSKFAIEKACEFLKNYRQDTPDGTGYIPGIINDQTIEDFRKAIEE